MLDPFWGCTKDILMKLGICENETNWSSYIAPLNSMSKMRTNSKKPFPIMKKQYLNGKSLWIPTEVPYLVCWNVGKIKPHLVIHLFPKSKS